VTEIFWINNENLFFNVLVGLQTVYGQINIVTQVIEELLSTEFSSGKWYPQNAFLRSGEFAINREGRDQPQEGMIFQDEHEETLLSLAHDGSEWLRSQIDACKTPSWHAEDGLEIHGFLTLPRNGSSAPHPLIVDVHGGPVRAWQDHWADIEIWAFYVSRGYTVLFPNPRGSAGRGQDFIRGVYGDMGGADHKDILIGIDQLVKSGIVDSTRVGVTSRSYGGTMSAWIITQTDGFVAAVPIAAACD